MLQINDLVYRIDRQPILEDATAHVPAGHKVGLVGRNGAGKTTLLRLIAGRLLPDDGVIHLRRNARVGVLEQEAPGGDTLLIDEVLAADHERARLLRVVDTAETPEQIADVHQRLADIGAHNAPARAAAILAGLGFDEAAQRRPLKEFSGGWRMRVALAALLFTEPDLLLLDEPTNYLDLEGSIWLEGFLRSYPRTVLIVSHDRDVLNRVVGSILHLHDAKLTFYRGDYDTFERTRAEQLALQAKNQRKQQATRAHMQAFVDRFRYKATKARQAQSRLKKLARMQEIDIAAPEWRPTFQFPEPPSLPSPIITMEDASVGYDDAAPVLQSMNLRIDMDDRIALLGRNGNGKSTFAKLLSDRLSLCAGELNKTKKLKTAYFAQHQLDELRALHTAYEHMADAVPGERPSQLRARLGAFGLSQVKADLPVSELSGGEKARLLFALLCREAPHLLILDEPTNHLDVDARQALADALNSFSGAVMLISHDRHLVDMVADHLWLVDEGTVRPYDGDLADYRQMILSTSTAAGKSTRVEQRASGSRKARRKDGAAARTRLTPYRRAIKDAEAHIDKLNAEREAVALALADPALYDGEAARITELNKRRADLESALQAAEHTWLAATEALENERAKTADIAEA